MELESHLSVPENTTTSEWVLIEEGCAWAKILHITA